ncbi:MAG: hypothetical protein JSU63_06860 [Phycisphaerales bacterium]|nr:MAG: hypothetical protein JSU63_06860 [Phycisphaerales bacterium]
MSQFIMIGWDGPNGARRREKHRDRHLSHIEDLDRAGKIAFAGPIRDDMGERSIGAVVVFEAESLEDAQAVADKDPYVAGGVFETVTVNPFKQVFPEAK